MARDCRSLVHRSTSAPSELVAVGDLMMTYDLSHAAMHRPSDWPILALIAARHTQAKRLDSRAVANLYARATETDWQVMTDTEIAFGHAALTTWPQ